MTIYEAFDTYIHEEIPLAVDATVTVTANDAPDANVMIDVSGEDVHARYIANGIHKLLCNTVNVVIGAGRYMVALAYSPMYCPVDVGEIGEYKYKIPVSIQYIDNGEQEGGG